MDLEAFKSGESPPADASPCLAALWHDAAGEWATAHELVQDCPGPEAAWVHGYLHRKEGDRSNAAHWYRLAERPFSELSLEEEWASITASLLGP